MIKELKIGDIIKFGFYINEPIEWEVRKIENNKILLVTKDIIETKAFDTTQNVNKCGNNEWVDSEVRCWLNNYFYNTVFSKEEKSKIQLYRHKESILRLKTEKHREKDIVEQLKIRNEKDYNIINIKKDNKEKYQNIEFEEQIEIQKETRNIKTIENIEVVDKVFLLSCEEVDKYYKNDKEREKKGTKNAINNGLYVYKSNNKEIGANNSFWWLRSKFEYTDGVYFVNHKGDFYDYEEPYYNNVGIVCAVIINIDNKG